MLLEDPGRGIREPSGPTCRGLDPPCSSKEAPVARQEAGISLWVLPQLCVNSVRLVSLALDW